MSRPAGSTSGVGALGLIVAAGGAIAAAGAFLSWASLDVGPRASELLRPFIDQHAAPGFSAGWPGAVALVGGAVAVGAGIAMIRQRGRTVSLIAAIASGLVVAAVIAAFAQLGSVVGDAELDSRTRFGVVAPSVGLLITAAGGALALVGGLLALARSSVRSR